MLNEGAGEIPPHELPEGHPVRGLDPALFRKGINGFRANSAMRPGFGGYSSRK